jgi:predicted ester cyclase
VTVQSSQAIARRYLADFWNRGDETAINEIVAADAIGHVAGKEFTAAPSMLFARRAALLSIYSAPTFTLEDEIAAGDKVVIRWTFRSRHTGAGAGVPPTGKEVVATGINIFRIADGKIAELWVESDDLGELRQLGVIPGGS